MLKYLFQPIQIGNIQIKNRVSMPAMHLHYVADGFVTDQLIQFYHARAQGGAGMIIVGGCAIDDIGAGPGFIGLDDDKYLPGLNKLTKTLTQNNTIALAQLYHAGKYAPSHHIGGQKAVSSSAKRSKLTGEMPQELDKAGIEKIQEAFASAAARAQKAGFHGVEIIGSAGYLICQFLSEAANSRKDEYGGSMENRMRFGIETIEKVRAKVDKNFLVQVRLSGNDFVKNGNTNQEWQIIAQAFEKAGTDVFNVTGGWHETKVPQITMGVPHGAFIYLASGIKSQVSVPVIASNRINDPVLADEIIRLGLADMVNFGRPLIADPDMPRKALNGQLDLIDQCIACNQGCFDSVFMEKPVECLVNPMVSREKDIRITKADTVKNVVVIGGGVGGMKAALTANKRGHNVTLYEQRQLGGQMDIVAASPDRHEFATLSKNLTSQINASNINVIMDRASISEIQDAAPDEIILATGGKEIKPNIPGIDLPHVHSAWSVLRNEPSIGQNIVIIGGGAVGCETALTLAHIGTIDGDTARFLIENEAEDLETIQKLIMRGPKQITIVEMLDKMGKDIGITTRWTILQDLKRHKVQMVTKATVKEIRPDSVIYSLSTDKAGATNETFSLNADTVIYAVGTKSDNELLQSLQAVALDISKNKACRVHVIGDAHKPRKAMDAVHEGFFTALDF